MFFRFSKTTIDPKPTNNGPETKDSKKLYSATDIVRAFAFACNKFILIKFMLLCYLHIVHILKHLAFRCRTNNIVKQLQMHLGIKLN